jgi:tRNA G18 (ribose-2'-O)-methylase SpoU
LALKLLHVDDINTDELKIYSQLRDRFFTQDGSFIADSPKVVNILLKKDIKIKSILATKSYYDEFEELILDKDIENLYVGDKKLLESIVGHKIHHNCMMHAIRPQESPLDKLDDNIIMLDSITSSENVGSIARSAAALGVNSYLLSKHSPHPYSRRALRVSMGYVSMLKTHIYSDIFDTLKTLKNLGYTIYAAEVTPDAIELSQIKAAKRWVLLMGHEGKGISEEVLKECDKTLKIEMASGIKSFNVGVAASILMYKFKN